MLAVLTLVGSLLSDRIAQGFMMSPSLGSSSCSLSTTRSFFHCPFLLHASSSSSSSDGDPQDERQMMLAKAKKLRDEARTLEDQVQERRVASPTKGDAAPTPSPDVTKLSDSTWTISYRFSSQPKEDDEDSVIPNYSGKMTVFFKGDGYSELKSMPDSSGAGDTKTSILKIWGWDEENSQEDNKQYLLFSMDVQFPKSDPKLPGAKARCYFQARIDKDSRGSLSLSEGTVTVKKDVSEKTNGMWGLFQVAGILSQFRYVGDFIAKPS